MCWGGVLNADFKDGEAHIENGVCTCRNPVDKIQRMEKGIFPRQNRKAGTVSNLLPRLKWDALDDDLGILKISSVVDGTDVRGIGNVGNHSYRWRMAIESMVKSIAVVPDRFFDVTGRSYPIDQQRKVSADSLPTYVNYKDAVIYRINKRTKHTPVPLAKIIYDNAVQGEESLETVKISVSESKYSKATLGYLIQKTNGYKVYENGLITHSSDVLSAIASLDEVFEGSLQANGTYKYEFEVVLVKLKGVTAPTDLPEYTEDMLNDTLISYLQNHATTDLVKATIEGTEGETPSLFDEYGSIEKVGRYIDIIKGDYLAIIVDANDDYHALIGVSENGATGDTEFKKEEEFAKKKVTWYLPSKPVNVSQFKGLDMWIRFEGINSMIYYIINKYSDNIVSIQPSTIYSINDGDKEETFKDPNCDVDKGVTNVEKNNDRESKRNEGRLWAYINPRTMTPYPDDYWFHQGEPYYKSSITIAPPNKKIKGHRISVKAGQFPGMYMLVGETWIRSRDDGQDERMQIKFPMCKIMSEQALTLEADGDPTVFNLSAQVANPPNGIMMELTAYEVADRVEEGEDGCFYLVDGSTNVRIE